MFARLMPRSCSTLSVFVSYSHEQRALGEEIAQALKNAGHDVFFDLESIPASGDYNDRIRCAIEEADRFVFIASKEALAPGKFTLTELQFARERWPIPAGKVIPVLIDDRVRVADLPVYLRSISVMKVEGNAVAEIVGAVQKTRRIGTLCKSVTFGASTLAAVAALYAGAGLGIRGHPTDVVLIPPQSIHFRPAVDAPLRATEQTAADWASSNLSVTIMPVSYTHRTEPGRRARILKETVELSIGGKALPYRAAYVVEITDAPCGDRWFCIKGNAGVETLEPGASINRETMFAAATAEAPSWRQFIEDLLSKPGLAVTASFRSTIEVSEDTGPKRLEMRADCGIDTEQLRLQLEKAGFRPGGDSKPTHIETDCLQAPTVPTVAAGAASPGKN